MQKIYDFFLTKFSDGIKKRLEREIKVLTDANPNERLRKSTIKVLKESLEEKDSSDILLLAELSCYITFKMQANEDFIRVLKQVKHPYIDIFVAYFEENPSNYQETVLKIEKLASKFEKHRDYNEEKYSSIIAIQTWIYGQQGDIVKLKELNKYITKRIQETKNKIEQFGLQDAYLNVIWWFLHSGLEANIEEMIEFIDSYIKKYNFYKIKTTYLNVKGAISSFIGNNTEAMKSFRDLITAHEEYNDNYRLSIARGNLAETYFDIGQLNKAKEMMEQAISLYRDSTGKWPFLYLTEIGNIYYILDDPRAEESFLHAYDIQKKEKSLHKAYILYEVVHFYLRKEDLNNAKKYLGELRTLAIELETPIINARVDYLRGFYQMLNHNLSNALTFLQLANEQFQTFKDIELTLVCNIQLAVVHLFYYRLLEKQESLNLALNYIENVVQLAVENTHNQTLTTGLMIKAVLNAVNNKQEEALEAIEKAKNIMKDIDFDRLKRDIEIIKTNIEKANKTGIMEIEGENFLEYILPQFKTLLSLKMIQKKRKKAEVLGLLIISESGIPIYSKLKESLKANDLLLSGLLMAITHLAGEITESKEMWRLQDVAYEHFTITIQAIKNGLIAVIATEMTSEIRMWSSSIADRIKEVPVVITRFVDEIPEKIKDLQERMNI